MEPADILIDDMDLAFAVPADHASVFFEGVAAVNGGLALFYDQLVQLLHLMRVLFEEHLGRKGVNEMVGLVRLVFYCLAFRQRVGRQQL